MTRLITLLIASAALACAAPAAQSRGASVPPEATPPAADRTAEQQIRDALSKGTSPKDILVCEYEEVTGTHFRDVICRSLSEKERQRVDAQEQLQTMQRQNQVQRAQ